MVHDGWMYQGRQHHQWFGHGTKPRVDDGPSGSLDERIRTLGRTAVASLPAGKRGHSAATFDDAATGQLVTAVRGWIRALDEPAAKFAASLLGSTAAHPAVEAFRHAAELVSEAQDHASMREASDALAAGMQAVGLDCWHSVLRDYAERAQSGQAGFESLGAYRFRLRTAQPAAIRQVAIDFDPRDVPLTPTAQKLDELLNLTGQVVLAEMNAEALNRSPMPRSNVLHKKFADAVRELHLPGVKVEQSFNRAGQPEVYGQRDTVRTDVIFTNPDNGVVEGIWDWKVGGADLGLRRAQLLSERVSGVAGQSDLPPYRIPVRELHVDPVLVTVPAVSPP